jgi:hypothetical protein
MGRRKDLLLFVLAVVALVVAIYTFRRPAAPTTAKAAPAATTQAQDKAGVEGDKKAREGTAAAGALSRAGTMRSPFEGPAAGAGAETAQKPAPAEKTPTVAPQPPLPTGAAPSGAKPLPTPTEAPPATKQGDDSKQTLTLNGILAGKQAMAVIRQGEQRYYVKAGEEVGQYRVKSISQKEVVLVGKAGNVTLRMGGRQ